MLPDSNVQSHQAAAVARNLGMTEMDIPAGELAVFGHPRLPERITVLQRRRTVPMSDLVEQFEAIGFTREEIDVAFGSL